MLTHSLRVLGEVPSGSCVEDGRRQGWGRRLVSGPLLETAAPFGETLLGDGKVTERR